jgi:hypothetical protein
MSESRIEAPVLSAHLQAYLLGALASCGNTQIHFSLRNRLTSKSFFFTLFHFQIPLSNLKMSHFKILRCDTKRPGASTVFTHAGIQTAMARLLEDTFNESNDRCRHSTREKNVIDL